MPLISIILPVYNTEYYLSKCINSILTQTLSDFELIIINDGSIDNSEMICNQYGKKDSRIRLFHQENHGVGYTRNRGLELSHGKYIYFIDSDDWIEKEMLETLYLQLIENQADLSTCGYIIEDTYGNCLYKTDQKFNYTEDKWGSIYSLFNDKFYRYKGYLWDKLYSKEIIDRYHIRFNEDIYYNEDRLFIFKYLIYCTTTIYTTKAYYHYIIRNSSAMNLFHQNYDQRHITFMDAFDIMTMASKDFPSYIQKALSDDYIKNSLVFFREYSSHIPPSEIKKRVKRIIQKNLFKVSVFKILKYTYSYIKIQINQRLFLNI